MTIKLKLFPYKLGSASAKKLASALNIKRVKVEGNYYHYSNHAVINWGSSFLPSWFKSDRPHLNHPSAVAKASNKLSTFLILQNNGVSIPKFTTDIAEAALLCDMEEKLVLCRTTLTGHSGAGIVVAREATELVPAPLYTQHVRHKREFRIHVFNGVVIDATEKKKSSSHSAPDAYIRSHLKGWKFCREGVIFPEAVTDVALDAVNALGLDFGAVDVGYREREDKAYIFEVNTAPGLEGTTLEKYIGAFNGYIQSRG